MTEDDARLRSCVVSCNPAGNTTEGISMFITFDRESFATFLTDNDLADADTITLINRWVERGDGAAVYRNDDLGHPQLGHVQVTSFGSPEAQLEVDEAPTTLPDIGGAINWRYQLVGTYRGEPLTTVEAKPVRFRADILARGETRWATNALRFDTEDEATDYAKDLANRWTQTQATRVVPEDVADHEDYDPDDERIVVQFGR